MDTDEHASEGLDALLEEAAAAPPGSRIEFRDRIAEHGVRAVNAMKPWLANERLAPFAVRVIEAAAPYSAKGEAIEALTAALQTATSPALEGDATGALARLNPTKVASRRTRAPGQRPVRSLPSMSPEELVAGQTYRRRELHLQGLGGNRQSGISYPADGSYVLLFSDPSRGHEHGYADRWVGDQYFYYGQWTGTGDMVFEVGNRAILDRHTELYLFIAAPPKGYRTEGRFRLARHATERTVRDGREWTAIVFVLEPYSRR